MFLSYLLLSESKLMKTVTRNECLLVILDFLREKGQML